MLTCVEVSGLYLQRDTGLVCAFDHIDVEVLEHSGSWLKLRVTNRTKFPARVMVLSEASAQTRAPLSIPPQWGKV